MAVPRYPSSEVDISLLAQPLKFENSGVTAKNRIIKTALTERLASFDRADQSKRGVPTPELIRAWGRWGSGGFGAMLTGCIQIETDYLEGEGNMVVPPDEPTSGPRFEAFQQLASAAKKEGSLIMGQLCHPGKAVASYLVPEPFGAWADANNRALPGGFAKTSGKVYAPSKAASREEIKRLEKEFAEAADYLAKAGFDGACLHSGEVMLFAQFLHLEAGQRDDEYGGSHENNVRFLRETLQAVVARVPKKGFAVGTKISTGEFLDAGWEPAEVAALVLELESDGLAFVDLNGYVWESHHCLVSPGAKYSQYFHDVADAILPKVTKLRVIVEGGIRTVEAMVGIVQAGGLPGIARPVAHEPDVAKKILEGKIRGALLQPEMEGNDGFANAVAGAQIRRIAKGMEPLDITQEKYMSVVRSAIDKWSVMPHDQRDIGYPEITAIAV